MANAKGDLHVGKNATGAVILPVGADGQVIVADSTQTGGIKWANSVTGPTGPSASVARSFRAVLDGGGSVLTTGAKKAYIVMPYDGTITSWQILADQSGSIVLDIWKDTYANYPPTVADTITASDKPTLTTAIKATGSALTGWTTSFAQGDVLEINIDSVTTVTKVYLDIFVLGPADAPGALEPFILVEQTGPTGPAAGELRLYAGLDNSIWMIDSNGKKTNLGDVMSDLTLQEILMELKRIALALQILINEEISYDDVTD